MKEIDYKMVGRRMQELRIRKGYTQDFVAHQLDVTPPFISNIENNKAKLNLRVLLYYAKLLNVSVDYLLFADTGSKSTTDLSAINNGQDQQILRILNTFTEDQKEKLISILEIVQKD